MYGLERLPLFPFVQVGFVAVMVTGTALGVVYTFGRRLGRDGVKLYANGWMIALGLVLIGNYGWAVASGQWVRFGREIGWSALIEMVGMAVLFIFSMWFMASRYAEGMRDRIDE